MAEHVAETLRAGTKAAEALGRPNILVSVIAILALLGSACLVWRDEVRLEAQIKVLEKMAEQIGDLRGAFIASGIHVPKHDRAKMAEAPE